MNKYLKARQVKPAATTRSAAGSAAIAAARFSWDRTSDGLASIYRELIAPA